MRRGASSYYWRWSPPTRRVLAGGGLFSGRPNSGEAAVVGGDNLFGCFPPAGTPLTGRNRQLRWGGCSPEDGFVLLCHTCSFSQIGVYLCKRSYQIRQTNIYLLFLRCTIGGLSFKQNLIYIFIYSYIKIYKHERRLQCYYTASYVKNTSNNLIFYILWVIKFS